MTYTRHDETLGPIRYTCAGLRRVREALWHAAANGTRITIEED